MRNSLELLRRAGEEREILPQALETMGRQLDLLVRLVDDLLDLSRITHNRVELRQSDVDLEPIVRRAVEAARPFAESRRHVLRLVTTAGPIPVSADPVRLAQIFGNLLHNSTKYTPSGGEITVTVERRGEEGVVTVRDTGAGIPPEKLDSVFEMFSQVERHPGHIGGGLGIGLTLVKRLVELHGGSVGARSEGPGTGSEFEVRLPLLQRAVVRPEPPRVAAAADVARGRRALVVDDNLDSATSLATLLRLSGFETEAAHDGAEALAAIERSRPDVVLLDIGLPRLDGFEVCRRVREQPWGRGLRMVALTGWGQEEDRRRSQEAGFDAHLVKPVDYEKLLQLLG
jgi:CheY-like chemotaxis protein/two-component sensor histidine kinase